jgi:hypothetical protein
MKKLTLPLIILTVTLLACSVSDPVAQPDAGQLQTQIAEGVAATLNAAQTGSATSGPVTATVEIPPTLAPTESGPIELPTSIVPTLPPPTPRPIPTAFTPTSTLYPDSGAVYGLEKELVFGEYAVRFWRNTVDNGFNFAGIVVIAAQGQAPIQIESVLQLNDLTGTDVDQDGNPDVVIETYTGGAHCCSATIVYSMTPTAPREILHSVESNCGGRLIDFNGDGILEFETCDDSFAYTYCPYAASPIVQVIYAVNPQTGLYQPASPQFANLYAEAIAADTHRAEQGQPGENGEWDNTNKCSVLPLVLDYLYSGRTDRAWSEFNRLYTHPDAATFRSEIETTVFASPRYVAP